MFCQIYSCRMSERACRVRQQTISGDLGCQNCETGKQVMQRHKQAQANLEQIEENLEKKKRGRPPKKIERQPENSDPVQQKPILSKPTDNSGCILIDFSTQKELLERINRLSAQELRTVENQILYMLIQCEKNCLTN